MASQCVSLQCIATVRRPALTALRTERDCDMQVIGEQVGTLQRKVRRKSVAAQERGGSPRAHAPASARGELSLVAATIRESAADPRKFYVQCGGVSLQVCAPPPVPVTPSATDRSYLCVFACSALLCPFLGVVRFSGCPSELMLRLC